MAHAILSPSASGRWLTCPASVRMCRDLPEQEESIYAREGTQFHTLCELSARLAFLDGSHQEYQQDFLDWALETEDEWHEDQMRYVEDWMAFLEERIPTDEPYTLLLEERLNSGVPGVWGTGDVVLITEDNVEIIDIKYGAGVRVSAVENSQLRFYGLGALNLVDDPLKIHTITMTVWQPRLNNISSETLTRKQLLKWKRDVVPIAELALGEDAPFGPSEDACRWCPIAGECGPRTRQMLNQDYGNPDLLTGEEMAEAYSRVSELKKWASDIEDAALKMAYEEADSVPGFKVVRSGGRRQILDGDKAVEKLVETGYDIEDVSTRKPNTLGQLDKLVGAEKLQDILGDVLVKSEGRLSLAKDSDPRPPADAVHSAQDDFAEITE